MRIIAFGHKARQGKTWSANFLASRLPGRSLVWGFGDGLKAVARASYGMGPEKDPILLQRLGEGLRQEDPAIWIKVWEGAISDQEGLEWVLVPDLRYKNEALFLKTKGAILAKVNRLNPDGSLWVSSDRDPSHISEIDLDDWPSWDVEVSADSTASLAFALHEAFLEGQIRPRGRKMFHLHSRFALGRG